MIVDPANGRIPPLNPEAQKIAAADRDFRLALMQATETWQDQIAGVQRGQIRSQAHAPAHGPSCSLQHRADESP